MTEEDPPIALLRQVKEVLDKHEVEYWLDSGTLLGTVRDGKLIPWDKDIDLSTWYASRVKVLRALNEFMDAGFAVISVVEGFRIIGEGEHYVDIGFYLPENGMATRTWIIPISLMNTILQSLSKRLMSSHHGKINLRATSLGKIIIKISHALLSSRLRDQLIEIIRVVSKKVGFKHIRMAVPSKFFTNFSTTKLYGMEFRVPARTEEYLTFRYGEDWRRPQKDWTFYRDDRAFQRGVDARNT